MIRKKSPEEIEIMKEGGRRLAQIVQEVSTKIAPGISIEELEIYARKLIADNGDTPAFLNYKPHGAKRPYPSAMCISVNDEIIHGIPVEDPHVLQNGDIVTLDLGLKHKGLITDHAITFTVGDVHPDVKKLLNVTKESLMSGIKAAQLGGRVGDIGAAIQKHADKNGYGIAEGLTGHGVGYEVHEDPYVMNWGKKGTGELLEEGMVIAIEPMFTMGTDKTKSLRDGYTVSTADGSLSAHFEHTVAITKDGPVVLTKI